jgi:hypothetical protein
MQNDRELDDLIDEALPGYSLAEPRPGLEQRILACARAEQHQRKRFSWPWLFAASAAACLLLLFFLSGPNRPSRKSAAAKPVNTPVADPVGAEVVAKPAAPVLQPKRVRSHPLSNQAAELSLPKQDVFPTPQPLTAEERTLIALSRVPNPMPRHPEAAAVNIEPIRIAELQIAPLVVPTLDESTQPITKDKQP